MRRASPRLLRTALLAWVASATACGARSDLAIDDMDGGPLDAGECVPAGPVPLAQVRPEVLFVIDRSGSMGRPLGMTSTSRAEALQDALAATLPAFDGQGMTGALLYPHRAGIAGERTCSVSPELAVPVGAMGSDDILTALASDAPPGGGTPTADALGLAYGSLRSARAPSVILATDGGPNCNPEDRDERWYGVAPEGCPGFGVSLEECLDDERTLATMEEGLGRGIPTYVVGMDVSLPPLVAVLDQMAVAGGRARDASPRFYDATEPSTLRGAFERIASEIGECRYVAPGGEGDVQVDGRPTRSWRSTERGTLELLGSACERARAGAPVTFAPRCPGEP